MGGTFEAYWEIENCPEVFRRDDTRFAISVSNSPARPDPTHPRFHAQLLDLLLCRRDRFATEMDAKHRLGAHSQISSDNPAGPH